MAKRFYYTDPLAAAWMAKHFGMRFTTAARNGAEKVQSVYSMALHATYTGQGLGYHYQVHPDSLHLLEPQVDDIILRTNGYCQQVGWQIGTPKAKAQLEVGATIIQRNGLAFHWPESGCA